MVIKLTSPCGSPTETSSNFTTSSRYATISTEVGAT